jgi:hypothetical protein
MQLHAMHAAQHRHSAGHSENWSDAIDTLIPQHGEVAVPAFP